MKQALKAGTWWFLESVSVARAVFMVESVLPNKDGRIKHMVYILFKNGLPDVTPYRSTFFFDKDKVAYLEQIPNRQAAYDLVALLKRNEEKHYE